MGRDPVVAAALVSTAWDCGARIAIEAGPPKTAGDPRPEDVRLVRGPEGAAKRLPGLSIRFLSSRWLMGAAPRRRFGFGP